MFESTIVCGTLLLDFNGRHIAGLIVGPLLSINLYSLFYMFNFTNKGRGNDKLANDKK